MATSATAAGRPTTPDATALTRLLEWAKGHRQVVGYLSAVIAVGAVLFGWSLLTARSAEQNASRQLEQGTLALASKNYPLAASVLAQVVENFSGTHAAEQGNILLAQVRLAQGQTQQAIDILKRFAPKADAAYRAQAYGLLGGAYENAARPRDAADAYRQASEAAPFPFLRAQFLSDAGRAWLAAGDTTQALAAYRTIVQKLDSTSAATEAKVRLGELTRGAAGAVGTP
ncbi:MAG TPA: tetratricopeptide repeat protein [Gemmatimonadales bacterium]|nr:tetratricopeptide repeat protein [Gemmatimonadales bacterium]